MIYEENIIIIALLNSLYFQAQENQVFYYYNNEKIYLDKIENAKVIHFNKTIDALQKDYICNQLKAVNYITTEITPVMYTVSGNMIQFEQDTIVSAAIKNGNILYITDMLMYQDATILWTSNKIIIRIPLESDVHNVLLDNRISVEY